MPFVTLREAYKTKQDPRKTTVTFLKASPFSARIRPPKITQGSRNNEVKTNSI